MDLIRYFWKNSLKFSAQPMIDFRRNASQTASFRIDKAKLMITYDVTRHDRNYRCQNVMFAHTVQGAKRITVAGHPQFELNPETVIMTSSPVEAWIEIPKVSFDNPALCFCLEIAQEKIWSILDKILESCKMDLITDGVNDLPAIGIYYGKADTYLFETLKHIQQLMISDVLFKERWLDLKLEELVLCCLQTRMRETLLNNYSLQQWNDSPLSEVILYIKENLNQKIDIQKLAEKACMSKATFYRHFKQNLGVTPVEYLHIERIKKAKQLLTESNLSIGEVGFEIGYKSPSYFSTQFEKKWVALLVFIKKEAWLNP